MTLPKELIEELDRNAIYAQNHDKRAVLLEDLPDILQKYFVFKDKEPLPEGKILYYSTEDMENEYDRWFQDAQRAERGMITSKKPKQPTTQIEPINIIFAEDEVWILGISWVKSKDWTLKFYISRT